MSLFFKKSPTLAVVQMPMDLSFKKKKALCLFSVCLRVVVFLVVCFLDASAFSLGAVLDNFNFRI